MQRLVLLGSIAALIAACQSRTTTYATSPATGGGGGTAGDADGGTSSGGKGSGGSSSGGSAGKASGGNAGSAGDASGGMAGSGEAGMGGEGGGADDCPASGCPQSCDGLANDCGANGDQNCCASIVVPASVYLMGRSETAGASDYFETGDANETPEHAATTISIRIDKFEVTLDRFEKFFAALPNSLPAAGDGAHPGIPNSGWQAAWDDQLDALETDLLCGFDSVWTSPLNQDIDGHLPINCITYYAAHAFCAWDGGFLPTEADWEAIAAGGDENRLYPWGVQTPAQAGVPYDCNYDGMLPCGFADIPPVGSSSADIGRWGHFDLGGSMAEWVLDAFSDTWYDPGPGNPCMNCAKLPEGDLTVGDQRILRGGTYYWGPEEHRAAFRREVAARDLFDGNTLYYGIRCARAL